VAEPGRIDELRRRIQNDPASPAFAHLAEELRRAGDLHEAVRICRVGLRQHPDYVSARVTLGCALAALGDLADAEAELAAVVAVAPENLTARRALSELRGRREQHGPLTNLQPSHAHLSLVSERPDPGTMTDETRSTTSRADERVRAAQIAVLERWLHAIGASRVERREQSR
jgi:hypothetical protein